VMKDAAERSGDASVADEPEAVTRS